MLGTPYKQLLAANAEDLEKAKVFLASMAVLAGKAMIACVTSPGCKLQIAGLAWLSLYTDSRLVEIRN